MTVLVRIVVKEFLQLRRDRKMIPAMIVGPLLQLLALGFAANLDVRDIPFVLVDRDHSSASRELVDRFTGSGYFDLVGVEPEIDGVDRWLSDGRAQIGLVIGANFGSDLAAGRTADVQVLADGTDSISGVIGMGYAGRIVGEAGIDAQAKTLKGITFVPRVWYNPDLLSRWFYVPAILAMVLMLVTLILPSMAVVREKEIGTLEQIMVTPIRPWQLIVGKLAPFAIIGVEYSSMKFALFFMAEYAHMVTMGALAVTLFWGGWQPPHPALGFIPGFIWFCIKLFVFLFFFIWQRGTYPRLRYDQIMKFGWKVLLPLTLVNLLITALIVALKG